jgi:hypothetical protein
MPSNVKATIIAVGFAILVYNVVTIWLIERNWAALTPARHIFPLH